MIIEFPKLQDSFTQTELFDGLDYDKGDNEEVIEKVIYEHFRTYQISSKSPVKWKNLFFYPRLLEIMPMFNKLYASADLIVEPLTNRNYTISKTFSETESTSGSKDATSEIEKADATSGYNNSNFSNSKDYYDTENKSNSTSETIGVDTSETVSGTNSNTKKFSDTPQGAVANLTDGYLTNVTLDSASNSEGTTGSSDTESSKSETAENTSSSESSETGENRENFLTANSGNSSKTDTETTSKENSISNSSEETIIGYDNTDVAKLLADYRDTIININQKLIEAIADLFIQVYDYEEVFEEIFGE